MFVELGIQPLDHALVVLEQVRGFIKLFIGLLQIFLGLLALVLLSTTVSNGELLLVLGRIEVAARVGDLCDISSRDLARNALKLEKETTPDLVWWRRGASMALYRRKATGRRNQYPSLLLLDDVCPQPQFLLLRSSLFG